MSEFDAFEAAPAGEIDPAADFLAREQSELAGLEDDNFGTSDAQPAAAPEASQDLDAFGGDAPAAAEQVTNDSSGLGDFEVIGAADIPPDSNGPTNMYSAISAQDTLRAEPEKIKVWREEQKARLEAKDAEEEKKKAELRAAAKKELDDWYKHYNEQLTKDKENNRKVNDDDVRESQGYKAGEEAFVKERDEKVPGQAWEKVTKLCEFNPKGSKTTKDVSRMRGILLQLKQTPLVR